MQTKVCLKDIYENFVDHLVKGKSMKEIEEFKYDLVKIRHKIFASRKIPLKIEMCTKYVHKDVLELLKGNFPKAQIIDEMDSSGSLPRQFTYKLCREDVEGENYYVIEDVQFLNGVSHQFESLDNLYLEDEADIKEYAKESLKALLMYYLLPILNKEEDFLFELDYQLRKNPKRYFIVFEIAPLED